MKFFKVLGPAQRSLGPSLHSEEDKMPLIARDVGLDPDLLKSFSDIGTKAKTNIGRNYADLQDRYRADARGFRPGGPDLGSDSYAGQRFAKQQSLDTGGLEAALGS